MDYSLRSFRALIKGIRPDLTRAAGPGRPDLDLFRVKGQVRGKAFLSGPPLVDRRPGYLARIQVAGHRIAGTRTPVPP